MKKAFVFGEKNKYSEELDAAFTKKDNNSLRVNLQDLSVDYLIDNKVGIVISNGLPNEWYYTFKGLKIVSLTIDNVKSYYDLADIIIDCKSDNDVKKYFTGPEFSICENEDFIFNKVTELIHKLDWDTGFFGYPVAFISCRELSESIIYRTEQFIRDNQIHLVEYLSNCHDRRSILLAEKNGYNFVDIRLKFEKKLKEIHDVSLPQGITFGLAEERHIPALENHSSNLYIDSRYFFDEHFDRKKINEFYSNWVKKAVQGTFDDECFCLFHEDQPVGFCTVKYKHSKNSSIRLFGLAKDYQGKGLGKILLYSFYNELKKKGIEKISVVTQGRNYGAQKLYQSTGFLTKETELWYHKWL